MDIIKSTSSAINPSARVIGWLLPKWTIDMLESFFTDPFKYLSMFLEPKGYNLVIFNEENYNNEKLTELHRAKMLDGLILFTPRLNDETKVKSIRKSGIPMAVMFSRYTEIDSFTCDNEYGGYTATKHLIDKGRKRIAFIHGSPDWNDSNDRFLGFRRALTEAKLDFDPSLSRNGLFDFFRAKIAVQELLSLENEPDAIFAANDKMAMGAIAAIKEIGLNVPKDISVIGFDDIAENENSLVPLTTLAQPIKEISEKLANRLVAVIEGRADASRAVFEMIKPKLIVRSST